MQFYKINATVVAQENAQENAQEKVEEIEGVENVVDSQNTEFASLSEKFNEKLGEKGYFFVAEKEEDTITIGAVQNGLEEFEKELNAFFEALNIKVKDIHSEETTLLDIEEMLEDAERCTYINGKNEVGRKFNFRVESPHTGFDCCENIIPEAKKSEIYKRCNHLILTKEFTEELDRIYQGKGKSSISGHPVHYMVETDDNSVSETMTSTLIQALHENGRVQNKRYSVLSLGANSKITYRGYENWYKNNIGGTVVVRFTTEADAEDEEDLLFYFGKTDAIPVITEMMNKYRNQVLTIFSFSRECSKTKEEFFKLLSNVSFIELQEDLARNERATQFLAKIARKKHTRTNKRLFDKVKANKGYLASELRAMYETWYDEELKISAYPQYQHQEKSKEKIAKAGAKGSAFEKLNQMVGLREAKKVITDAINFFKLHKLYEDQGVRTERPSMHMIFTGNPGTAKTTVARLFSEIMRDNGILSKGHLVEVGRGDLVGKYVGHTAPQIQQKFQEALGGVLFIDEAYSLVDGGKSFGDEAINTIVQEMENHRDELVVIFAGYPKEMEEFLHKNPGLRSRISTHVSFDDYNADELCDIARLIAEQKHLKLTDGAYAKLKTVFGEAAKDPEFGNGRYVRNAIEKAQMAQAARLMEQGISDLKAEDITTLCADDFEASVVEKKAEKPVVKMGFVA